MRKCLRSLPTPVRRTCQGIDRATTSTATPRGTRFLSRPGGRHVYDRDDVGYWCRPGKSRGCRRPRITAERIVDVFTSSTSFQPDRSYDKFGAYAVLQHGGDVATAARALATDAQRTRGAASDGPDDEAFARAPVEGRPVLVRLEDVQPEAVTWLWPGRLAVGKLALLVGDPGLGKSWITLDLAAPRVRRTRHAGRRACGSAWRGASPQRRGRVGRYDSGRASTPSAPTSRVSIISRCCALGSTSAPCSSPTPPRSRAASGPVPRAWSSSIRLPRISARPTRIGMPTCAASWRPSRPSPSGRRPPSSASCTSRRAVTARHLSRGRLHCLRGGGADRPRRRRRSAPGRPAPPGAGEIQSRRVVARARVRASRGATDLGRGARVGRGRRRAARGPGPRPTGTTRRRGVASRPAG